MKFLKYLALIAFLSPLFATGAMADTFVTVPHPQAVFDSTNGALFSICPPGKNTCTTIPSAATNNLWSGTNNFSGTFQIGGTAQSFPASGLLVGRTDAQTLTNKTIVGPTPTACGATCSPTAGQLVLLNQAAGSTATIPTSSGSGGIIKFRITVATTSAAEKILLTTTTDAIIGTAIGENAATAKVFVGNASTYHSIQMPFAGSQPSGGFIGDQITCTDIAAGVWACDMNYQAGTTPTTPYSASTS